MDERGGVEPVETGAVPHEAGARGALEAGKEPRSGELKAGRAAEHADGGGKFARAQDVAVLGGVGAALFGGGEGLFARSLFSHAWDR